VTPESHWQDVRHLSFTVPSNNLPQYEPGDVITIYPKNFQEDVQELINIMDWTEVADKPLEISADSTEHRSIKGLYTLSNTTLRQLLIHNLDITVRLMQNKLK
jgi:sulfite reductase alpha subunit-like flavoprotein